MRLARRFLLRCLPALIFHLVVVETHSRIVAEQARESTERAPGRHARYSLVLTPWCTFLSANYSNPVRPRRMKTLAAVHLALVIAIASAGGTVWTSAAMLPGGSAEDAALREAAISHKIEAVK